MLIDRPRKPSKLRAARHARGLTLERCAVQAGISVAWLRLLERDPTLLSPAVAAKLLPVLGLTVDTERQS